MSVPAALRVPESECPGCHAKLDAADGVLATARPDQGDVTVCLHCGCVLVFDADLKLRTPTPEEWKELRKGDEWKWVQLAMEAAAYARQMAGAQRNLWRVIGEMKQERAQ